MTRLLTFCLINTFLFSGCGLLTRREVTPEEKQQIVFSAARVGTVLAITEVNKDKGQQIEVATGALSYANSAVAALSNPDVPPTKELQDNLFAAIPSKYRALMALALDTFNVYYELPGIGQVLKPNQVALLKAFFSGVAAGAQDILTKNIVNSQ